ncbi:chromatin structure-remodeling complex subunit RSC7 [Malassezia vespertilionis]|uniref:Uncharacterized protein n=1 Tax=Malassezia vespertilionis TaxID=2020962 RepID=A0A2N1JFS8_9BASI|nr:chromatin structure-remodeling complex subunit RSC7 [Malassezia vespertilionis]PKI85399.1 hypothetical protein MVES_000239 [Malassezia vespertilionis]WFD04928.1 chromatin structure-remodeling complex subunit RSC7 [Malassezia vespertilionis]
MHRSRRRTRREPSEEPVRRTRPRRTASVRVESEEEIQQDDSSDEYSEQESVPVPRRRRPTRAASPSSGSEAGADSTPAPDSDTVEVDGREYEIKDDQLALQPDPEGDKKVDAQGRLQGGRTYRVPTFTMPWSSDQERLYMLAIDVARALGFRDSAYFFRKHPLLHKISLSNEERERLATDRLAGTQLRVRNVTVVTARSVFQLVGARIVSRGRLVMDDYYESQARSEGHREGALVSMPSIEDILRAERRRESDRERERGRRKPDAATYTTIDPQGDAVVTTFGDAGHAPFERAGQWAQRRLALQRADITEENWMAAYARSAQSFNAELNEARRERLVAFPWFGTRSMAQAHVPPDEEGVAMQEDDEEHLLLDVRPPWERPTETHEARVAKQRAAKQRHQQQRRARQPVLGVYEPHTHMPQLAKETQAEHARMQKVDDTPHLDVPHGERARLATLDTFLVMPVAR